MGKFKNDNLNKIKELYSDSELLIAVGFDDAIIGVSDERVVYSVGKAISILMNDMSYCEAVEFFEYNVRDSYVGEKTPIWVDCI